MLNAVDLADMRLFVEIADSGNLTEGARRAFLSAPAASARIRAIEADLGAALLYRSNRGVSLTQTGEVFLRHARLILRQMAFLRDDLDDAAQGDSGHVRIYANTTAVTEFMPEALARFMAARPRVTVDLQERLTHDILRGVREGTADLGILSGALDVSDLDAVRFSTDRLVLAVPKGHVLATASALALKDTIGLNHIGLHEGSSLLDFLRRQLAQHGFDRMLRIQVRSFEAMCRMVEAGVGVGVVPESAALRHAHTMQIRLIRLTDDWALRDRFVVMRQAGALPACAQALVRMLCETRAGGIDAEPSFPAKT